MARSRYRHFSQRGDKPSPLLRARTCSSATEQPQPAPERASVYLAAEQSRRKVFHAERSDHGVRVTLYAVRNQHHAWWRKCRFAGLQSLSCQRP